MTVTLALFTLDETFSTANLLVMKKYEICYFAKEFTTPKGGSRGFDGLIFYDLVILTKLCKIQYLNYIRPLLFPRNQVFLSEKLKTLTRSNYHKN